MMVGWKYVAAEDTGKGVQTALRFSLIFSTKGYGFCTSFRC